MLGKTVKVIVDRPLGTYLTFTKEDIMKQVEFQEKYFKTEIVM